MLTWRSGFYPAAYHATEEERDDLAQMLADISSVDKQTVRPPSPRSTDTQLVPPGARCSIRDLITSFAIRSDCQRSLPAMPSAHSASAYPPSGTAFRNRLVCREKSQHLPSRGHRKQVSKQLLFDIELPVVNGAKAEYQAAAAAIRDLPTSSEQCQC